MIIKSTNEDFDYHYGFKDISWNDKIILDLGADYGSTAECFLERGAKKIYAIEGDKSLLEQLMKFCSNPENKTVPIITFINTPYDLIYLISETEYDICKIDIEGYEIHLTEVPGMVLRKIKEYVIETHSNIINDKIIKKFNKVRFELKESIHLNAPEVRVLYFIRKD